jgi:hypothetical protein
MFSYSFYHIYCFRDMGELKYTTQGTFGGMDALIGQSTGLDEEEDENETT